MLVVEKGKGAKFTDVSVDEAYTNRILNNMQFAINSITEGNSSFAINYINLAYQMCLGISIEVNALSPRAQIESEFDKVSSIQKILTNRDLFREVKAKVPKEKFNEMAADPKYGDSNEDEVWAKAYRSMQYEEIVNTIINNQVDSMLSAMDKAGILIQNYRSKPIPTSESLKEKQSFTEKAKVDNARYG